jgi:predicted RNA-binding Zn-ribbon protein involved in translation (DUF1610 family)
MMGIKCLKCLYERQPLDSVPSYECPKCGAIYEKVESINKLEATMKDNSDAAHLSDEDKKKIKAIKRKYALEQKKLAIANKEPNLSNGNNEDQNIPKLAKIRTKTYTGNQERATRLFRADVKKMAEQGYYPTSQTWVSGSHGCGAFILALILCFILIGILVFIYMLIVKPDGTLSVTYELQEIPPDKEVNTKTCPRCAEKIKEAAVVCRYCNHEFKASE